MFKNFLTIYLFLAAFSPLLSREVDVMVELQIGNRVNETEIRVSSKKYTQLSMDGENLGFKIKLANEEAENEMFEISITDNEKSIAILQTIKGICIGMGVSWNGYRFEKELVITILAVKKVA